MTMELVSQIRKTVHEALLALYQFSVSEKEILVNETKSEFTGDYTVVLFAFSKPLKLSPDKLGQVLGPALTEAHPDLYKSFNVIKGFLNLEIADEKLLEFLLKHAGDEKFGYSSLTGKKVMVEYSSPNTNKPLHLGHLRNNFLGWSVAELFRATGHEVVKTCISNDRGIHICKSMLAWQLYANGATPESTGVKGDHFVGDYYVLFGNELKKQIEAGVAAGLSKDEAEKNAPLMTGAQQMLLDWEAGVPEVIELWKKMNAWVYAGFAATYKRIGSDFDKVYYESDTYLLGKNLVETGLEKEVFYKQPDGSVWIDLRGEGLDEKIVQRRDGTAVYMTQDIGLAVEKYGEFHMDQSIYVVADEQNYHFRVLRLICQKLGLPSADGIFHLSYGLVELPSGRMKTREGNVVDADDIVDEMTRIAATRTAELGKVDGFTEQELNELYDTIGIGALKFYLLRVDPKKRMIFNPDESIDFQGYSGPFIQFSYARIKSILRKESPTVDTGVPAAPLLPMEKSLLLVLERYPQLLQQACLEMNPSIVANYIYELAQEFSSFYAVLSVARAETEEKKQLRLRICQMTAHVISAAMALLGIRVPERM